MASSITSIADIQAAMPQILEQIPYLKLLVLFGSRARGDNLPSSDWDFALLFDEPLRQQYESGGGWHCYRSWTVLQQILGLGDDEIDWIDLKQVSDILAHTIASEGRVIYERTAGEFEKFRQASLKPKAELRQIYHKEREELELELQKWGV